MPFRTSRPSGGRGSASWLTELRPATAQRLLASAIEAEPAEGSALLAGRTPAAEAETSRLRPSSRRWKRSCPRLQPPR